MSALIRAGRALSLARRPPTDFELLREIYQRYREDFTVVPVTASRRASKILLPIDLQEIADRFGVDVDSIFGRLYYHFDMVYGERLDPQGGARKVFFAPVAGPDQNCINFPLLEAVLAGLWQERRRDLWDDRGSARRTGRRFRRSTRIDLKWVRGATLDAATLNSTTPRRITGARSAGAARFRGQRGARRVSAARVDAPSRRWTGGSLPVAPRLPFVASRPRRSRNKSSRISWIFASRDVAAAFTAASARPRRRPRRHRR